MQIPTFVLAIKDSKGQLRLAEGRRSDADLPVSFDQQYANFLFEFSESRIRCSETDEILLLQGTLDISDIKQDHLFVENFKRKIREIDDFTGWVPLRSKAALSEYSPTYRYRVSQHLLRKRSRTAATSTGSDDDSDVA